MSAPRWLTWTLGVALVAQAGAALADAPSVWARARSPEVQRRADLVAEAEGLQLRYELLHRPRVRRTLDKQEIATLSEMYLTRASMLLEEAGVRTGPDLFARRQLAAIYGMLGQPEKAAALLESILRAGPPPLLDARTHAELAIEYAHLGRVASEIDQYGLALLAQPVPGERARILANRAEAYMLLGDITSSVQGYREALAILATDGITRETGSTTLWGLAVALDRSGDLDAALDSVRVARAYDPEDRELNDETWFYLPDYDRFWYEALGHWMVARKTDMGSVRVAAYARAVDAWESYVEHAAPDDKWVAVARVRLARCKLERDAFLRQEQQRLVVEGGLRGKKVGRPPSPGRLDAIERLKKTHDPADR